MTFVYPILLAIGFVTCIGLLALIRWAGNKRSAALRSFAAETIFVFFGARNLSRSEDVPEEAL